MNSLTPTFTGQFIDPEDLDRRDVRIEDIAHALSMQCRYNGHTLEFYSVAEHCCLLARYIMGVTKNRTAALYALLHDAHEAYLGDVSRPVKPLLSDDFAEACSRAQAEIMSALGLPFPEALIDVEDADDRIINDEMAVLFPSMVVDNTEPRLGVNIECYSPSIAEKCFLDLYKKLSRKS
jgi:uncharacterized protein